MTQTTPDILGLAAELQRQHPITGELRLRLGHCVIEVTTNQSALHRQLRHYFRHYLDRVEPSATPDFRISALDMPEPNLGVEYSDWPRDAGKQGRKDTYCDLPEGRLVRKFRTGMQFILLADRALAVGPCLANSNQVINLVNSQYQSWMVRRGYLVCHSAAVLRGHGAEGGLGMSGFSGAGKSTLALRLISRGLDFVSNDRLLVGRENGGALHMAGVPKMPRINPGTILGNEDLWPILSPERLDAVRAMPTHELWDLEEKYDADIEQLFGTGRVRSAGRLDGFVVLSWNPRQQAPMELWRGPLRERPDLLPAIMKHPGVFHTDPEHGALPAPTTGPEPAPYLDVMGDMPVLAFSGGVDFEAAADECQAYLAAI